MANAAEPYQAMTRPSRTVLGEPREITINSRVASSRRRPNPRSGLAAREEPPMATTTEANVHSRARASVAHDRATAGAARQAGHVRDSV